MVLVSKQPSTVFVDGDESEPYFDTTGVPQGANLGPLFFLFLLMTYQELLNNIQ